MNDRDLERQVSRSLHDLFPQPADAALRVPAGRRRSRRPAAVLGVVGVVLLTAVAVGLYHAASAGNPAPAAHSAAPGPQRHPVDLAALTRRAPCPPPAKAERAGRTQLREFGAVAAVTCAWDERTYPHAGRWTVLVRKASGSDIAALVAAFDQPDQPPTNGACSLVLVVGAPLVLVDAKGNYLVPRYPLDACGQAQEGTVQVVRDHPWQTISLRKLKQQRTARELAAHCGARAKDMLYDAQSGQNLSPGEPVLNRHPDLNLHACIYRASPASLDAGSFVRGITLTDDQSASMRDALNGAGPTATCQPQRRFAYIATPTYDSAGDADWVIVELGGCWRVYFDEWPSHDGQWRTLVGTANPDVIGSLLHLGA